MGKKSTAVTNITIDENTYGVGVSFGVRVSGLFNTKTGEVAIDAAAILGLGIDITLGDGWFGVFPSIDAVRYGVATGVTASTTWKGVEYSTALVEAGITVNVPTDGFKHAYMQETVDGIIPKYFDTEHQKKTYLRSDSQIRKEQKAGELGDTGDGPERAYNMNRANSSASSTSQYGEEGGFGYSEYDRAHNSANGFEGGNNGGGASNKENFCDGWANDNTLVEMDIIKQIPPNRLIYVNYVSYGCFLKH